MTTSGAETDAWHRLPLAGVSETLTQNAACRRQLTLAGFWVRCRSQIVCKGKMGERAKRSWRFGVGGCLEVEEGGGGGGGGKLVGMAGGQVRRGPGVVGAPLGLAGKKAAAAGRTERLRRLDLGASADGSCWRVGRSRRTRKGAPLAVQVLGSGRTSSRQQGRLASVGGQNGWRGRVGGEWATNSGQST